MDPHILSKLASLALINLHKESFMILKRSSIEEPTSTLQVDVELS